jgi:enterochelin esterase-like enzyme
MRCFVIRRALCSAVLLATVPVVAAEPLEFQLLFDAKAKATPFTGRVHVLLSNARRTGPPGSPNWFRPEPAFALDVRDWKPGETLTVGKNALAYPTPLDKLENKTYWAMAVMDLDQGDRSFGAAPGNIFSKSISVNGDPATAGPVKLVLDQVVEERPFKETDRVKLVETESKLLSEFNHRSTKMRAAVVLPKSYAEKPDKRYPIIYEIPGFGGDHRSAFGAISKTNDATDVAGVEMLFVVLDPSCRTGHHVFADSANNGPCGEALIKELIPAIESKFRAVGKPGGRFVAGHSSGGWSSLWLQVTYPDFFGGVWSTAPDPVDFRDFQRINVYKPGTNMFTDEAGNPRPLARRNGKAVLFYKPFSDMEDMIGHGGQLPSFEAVFSPRGPDGRPRKLWDRKTGNVDPETAKAWEKYDIRLVLERNWKTLGPKLAGKLHVYMGGDDTFYLDGATALLKESLAKLGSDAKVEIFPGKDHSSLMDKPMRQRIAKEMAEAATKFDAEKR